MKAIPQSRVCAKVFSLNLNASMDCLNLDSSCSDLAPRNLSGWSSLALKLRISRAASFAYDLSVTKIITWEL